MNNNPTSTIDRAIAVSENAAEQGFDWNTAIDVLDKIVEEIAEIRQALRLNEPKERIAEECGDLFFALVNFNRKMQIDSENAFSAGIDKFERRFQKLVSLVDQTGHKISDLNLDVLESLWTIVKKEEKNGE